MVKYYSFTFSYFIFRILNFKTFILVSTVMNEWTNPLYLISSIYLIKNHYFCVTKGYVSAANPNVYNPKHYFKYLRPLYIVLVSHVMNSNHYKFIDLAQKRIFFFKILT